MDAPARQRPPSEFPRSHTVESRSFALDASWSLAVFLVLIVAFMAILAALWWPPGMINELMRENGPVENATVVWYGAVVAAVWLAEHRAFDKTSAAATSVLLIACMAKEISLRRRLLAAAGYEPCCFDATAWPNLLAAVFVLALLAAVAWLLWRYARTALTELPHRRPFALTLCVAFFCLVASQLMDHLLKVESQLGLAMSITARTIVFSLEEVLEMMIPVLSVVAVLQVGVRFPVFALGTGGEVTPSASQNGPYSTAIAPARPSTRNVP